VSPNPHTLPAYAELHCRSNFSFLTGASSPEELVQAAHARAYAALAITDECSLAGVVRAHGEAKRLGLHLLIGAQMQLCPPGAAGAAGAGGSAGTAGAVGPGSPASPALVAGPGGVLAGHAAPALLLLAQTRRGYGNLAQWISVARRRASKGQYLAYASDLEGRVPNAPYLAGLPDCFAILLHPPQLGFEALFAQAMWLKTWFGPERCALAMSLLHRPHEAQRLEVVPRVAQLTGLPMVACGDVLMHARHRKPLLDVLTARLDALQGEQEGRPTVDLIKQLGADPEFHRKA
jgi:error-prone DNA polymerase